MPSLHDVLRFFNTIPRGFSADGRSLGLGLASAMQAQQRRAAVQMETLRPTADTPENAGPRRGECVPSH